MVGKLSITNLKNAILKSKTITLENLSILWGLDISGKKIQKFLLLFFYINFRIF